MARAQGDKVLTALAGEYYVATELCRRGFVASLTLKNYPKVDIFALNPETQEHISVQVKTVRRVPGWSFFVPSDAEYYRGFFVFVTVAVPPASGFDTYILSGKEVAQLSRQSHDAYGAARPNVKANQPLMLGESELTAFRDNWQALLPSTNAGRHLRHKSELDEVSRRSGRPCLGTQGTLPTYRDKEPRVYNRSVRPAVGERSDGTIVRRLHSR